ncbi:LysR family transcriptional regulator [Lutimaribacter sp. EGI FJ00015]|uniref:LysR family transcriptional regulator n=1 Tax=Lutimaribacter degradans TaxID=2945989 RepID=A0ACC6A0C4_9RHOB|nr:LysR family transcriptional regulator [Lutimaribacter sp. EGI FJ00013]MCM2563229.1 LysR family transcriptional regulator [Lutimaribacter sp. EGI FJ00013]MCO0614448.1 LysR family transcriptional regulator [Lutimaribacter sp. EGI FJ00015]MCO0635951.1 LysR family transcriptional regulator [Lutimaribacter sp. EGI FJ00014]
MSQINYNHLRYFREVAHEGNLTRAARHLNLSQSALSTQIKQLEARLGHDLFTRTGRTLELTEAGRIALDHADRIFRAGDELLATLEQTGDSLPPLRVGALSTLSRNFQLQFLRPVLADGSVDLLLSSGSGAVLLEALRSLALDVVLTTEPPHRDSFSELVAHRLDEQPVGLYGTAAHLGHATLAETLANAPVILPTESSIRTGFDGLVARLGVAPRIAAEVDDMAMVRLLAREGVGLAIAPAVVLDDELAAGLLQPAPFDLTIVESFYAVTLPRRFPHPALTQLLPG